MLKYIFILFLVSAAAVFPQKGFQRGEERKPDSNLQKAVFIEPFVLPTDTNFTCYFSYKIPFNNILFLKDGSNFTGEISLKLEVHTEDIYLKSETTNKKITVDNYELTNSDYDFMEGILHINLPEGSYTIKPALRIENLNKDILLPPFPLDVKSSEPISILKPIVINKDKYSYNDQNFFRLVNAEGFLPYSINEYNLLIPVSDTSVKEIKASLNQNDKEIFNNTYTVSENIGFQISDLNNAVCITDNPSAVRTNLFVISDFSAKVNEGEAKLKISVNGEEKEFDLYVSWLNKPRTLINPEFAIRILENITPGQEVSNLTDGDEEDYYKNLTKYWEKFDQNKETAFNEVMNEFYQRADIAIKDYSTANNRDGTSTDRGKIYVKYGKPDEVQRSYSEKDNTLEIWIYKNLNKRFMFSDKDGLGNFTLLK